MNKLLSKSLSDKEVMKIVKNKANFVPYDELKYYKNIDEVLGKYGSALILYLSEPNYGHFVSLNKIKPDLIEHFDSYGIVPDDEIAEMKLSKEKKQQLGEDYPYLLKLMYDSPYKLSFNEYQLQSDDPEITTCGRFAALRTFFKDFSLKDFIKIFDQPNIGTPDEIACLLTSDIK